VRDYQEYSTWVEVDLGAIENNVRLTRQICQTVVMAVVKANGYGHGAIPVAQAALRAGAAWLGVARIREGIELRQAGLECPILLLGYTPPDKVEEAIRNRLSMTVWETQQIVRAAQISQRCNEAARLHLKIDTGMSRIGAQPAEVLDLVRQIMSSPDIIFEGVFTHFARADEIDPTSTDQQEDIFRGLLAKLRPSAPASLIVHAANSAASLYRPSAAFDMVRLGIAMYGLHPSPECRLPQEFKPALSWKTVLSHVKILPPGRGVSYGHEYFTRRGERIGTIPLGYADGFRRTAGNQVLVGGNKVPVVGRVCMDQCMLQLDAAPEACRGDEVVIIGRQGDAQITTEDIAQRWGTINHEVVCGIGARVPRLYIE